MNVLAEIFTSKSRAKIVEKLFDQKLNEFYLRQLERETGLGVVTLRDEIKRLLGLDLLSQRKSGNRIYYKANSNHPLYSVFTTLVDRTVGPRVKLSELLHDREDVEIAFIFGSYAKGETHSESDLDLFVMGRITSVQLSDLLGGFDEEIGMIEINPHNYKKKTLLKEIKEKKHFINSLKKTEKIFVKGSESEFRRLFK